MVKNNKTKSSPNNYNAFWNSDAKEQNGSEEIPVEEIEIVYRKM